MERFKIAIVVPCYNEMKSIVPVVAKVGHYGKVIVVDDGSTDGSAMTLASQRPDVKILRHDNNLGYSRALSTGINFAIEQDYDLIITFDADGQHVAEDIPAALVAISQGAALVIGDRPFKQRIFEVWIGAMSKWAFGVGDPCCGFRVYTKKALQSYGMIESLDSLALGLFFFWKNDREAPIHNLRISCVERQHGPSKFGGKISSNVRILKGFIFAVFEGKRRKWLAKYSRLA